jgi:DNA-binding CsgD family transcriptional regulator
MSVLYRRALPRDIAPAWPTVRSDWGLFPAAFLPRVPAIIADLVSSDRLTMCVLEDSRSKTPVLMGGFGFLPRGFIERAQRVQCCSILEQAFDAEGRSTPVFLGRRQVAEGNRARDLEMINFFASPPDDGPDFQHLVSAVYDAWQFFVKGFELNGIWQENASPRHDATLSSAGYRVARKFERNTTDVVTLFHTSRTDGEGSLIGSVMTSPTPVFGFTRAEQRLLECALLDQTDQEVADVLQVTPDAIKKRWRSINAKVSHREPATLAGVTSAVGRRRAILGRIRPRLEELRPHL